MPLHSSPRGEKFQTQHGDEQSGIYCDVAQVNHNLLQNYHPVIRVVSGYNIRQKKLKNHVGPQCEYYPQDHLHPGPHPYHDE